MLPLHQPLVVAEQFLVLDALHPGRVDLGLGRSLGFTPPVRRALRRDHEDGDTFEDDLRRAARLPRGHRRGDRPSRHRPPGADAPARHRARAAGRRPPRACPSSWAGRSSTPTSSPAALATLPPRRSVPHERQRAAGDDLPRRGRRRRRRDRARARPARGLGDGACPARRASSRRWSGRRDPRRDLVEPGTPTGRGLARPRGRRQPGDRAPPSRGRSPSATGADELLASTSTARPRRAARLGPEAARGAAVRGPREPPVTPSDGLGASRRRPRRGWVFSHVLARSSSFCSPVHKLLQCRSPREARLDWREAKL